jgi:predicted  nucleic acid-binding Zn-ribbon protein
VSAPLASLAEELQRAEDRVRAALKALDAANAELTAARRGLIAADRAYTKAKLERDLEAGQ